MNERKEGREEEGEEEKRALKEKDHKGESLILCLTRVHLV
jgi:hypothetical protein